MPTINLHEKYEKAIDERFKKYSLFTGRLSNAYSFIGAKTIKLSQINTVPLNDYNTGVSANRYGTPTDVGDTLQELTVNKKRSFSAVLDKTNAVDQAINKAAIFLQTEIDEVVNPERDKHTLWELAHNAGKVAGSSTAISSSNIIARLNAARQYCNGKRVPTTNRTWYVSGAVYSALIECDHFKELDKLGEKAICYGQVGMLMGAPVIEVPDDICFDGFNFMLVHRDAALNPIKLNDAKVNNEPQGISGTLVEGVYYYDAFVRAAKCDGVYVDVDTSSGKATVAANPTIATADGDITVASGYYVKYTTDGTDPRYSASATKITATTTSGIGTVGTVIKAVQTKDTALASAVVTVTVTGT